MRLCAGFLSAISIFFVLPAYGAGIDTDERYINEALQRNKCNPDGHGFVLIPPKPFAGGEIPAGDPMVFCEQKLKSFSCEMLAQLRNFTFHAYGRCYAPNRYYGYSFRRPECATLGNELRTHNQQVDDLIPPRVWSMVRELQVIETEKGCEPTDSLIFNE
jgi:hypothetical protein